MAVEGTDLVMVERAGTLHKTTAAEVAALGGGGVDTNVDGGNASSIAASNIDGGNA